MLIAREGVAFGNGKRIDRWKRHLLIETLGVMLRVGAHSAGFQDREGSARGSGRISLRRLFLEHFPSDCGYSGPRVAAAAPEMDKIVQRALTSACIAHRLARDVDETAARALFRITTVKLMAHKIVRYRDL